MCRNYRGNIANEINMLGCITFATRYGVVVRVQSKHIVCCGEFQDIAYWSTKGQTVGSTWLTVTSLLVVSTLTRLLLWLSHVGWVVVN